MSNEPSEIDQLKAQNAELSQRVSTLESELEAMTKKAETFKKGFEAQTKLHEQSMQRTKALSNVVGRDAAEALPIGPTKLLKEEPAPPQ